MKSILKLSLLVALTALLALGQTSLTSTTFSSAVAAGDEYVNLTSATGVTGRGSGATILYSGQEAMEVISISSTRARVQRGIAGSRQHAHASGATVYVGAPGAFANIAPPLGGACTAGTNQGYSPMIVVPTGRHYECEGSLWVEVNIEPDPLVTANVGTAATGVTAVEYGDGRRHITKLTFTLLTMTPVTAADAEATGILIYTLPAGAVVVNSASMSVGVYGSGTDCDADTPEVGLGTVTASGDTALLSGTATFESILTGTAATNCTGTVTLVTVSQGLGVETAGAHTVYLNSADTWAGICTITATGTVWLEWTLLD